MSALLRKLRRAGVGLHPGETIVAAMVLHPRGMARRVAMGGVVGTLMEERAQRHDPETIDDRGIAANMPPGPAILALTEHRAVVYDQGKASGRPKDVAVELPVSDIADIDIGKDRIGPQVGITFSDGTSRLYETPMRNGDVRAVVAHITG